MERKIIRKTVQFQHVIRKALERMGCVHRIQGNAGANIIPVPFEAANFNVESGLMWVKIHVQRLPRHYDFDRTFTQVLEEEIKRDFPGHVVITHQGHHLVIIGRYPETPVPSTPQGITAQSLNQTPR